jgi:hypothetical protein
MDPALMSFIPKQLAPLFIPWLVALTACGTSPSPERSVETYLNAIVEGDLVRASHSACSAWEAQANAEASSFEAVDAEIENLICNVEGDADGYTLVDCSGAIVAWYEGERQDFPLDSRTFQVLFEQGQWRMCGYWEG